MLQRPESRAKQTLETLDPESKVMKTFMTSNPGTSNSSAQHRQFFSTTFGLRPRTCRPTFDPLVFDEVVTYRIPVTLQFCLCWLIPGGHLNVYIFQYNFVHTTDATALPHQLQDYWVSVKVANGVLIRKSNFATWEDNSSFARCDSVGGCPPIQAPHGVSLSRTPLMMSCSYYPWHLDTLVSSTGTY